MFAFLLNFNMRVSKRQTIYSETIQSNVNGDSNNFWMIGTHRIENHMSAVSKTMHSNSEVRNAYMIGHE